MTIASDFMGREPSAEEKRILRRERRMMRIARATGPMTAIGLGWSVPLLKIAAGDDPRSNMAALWKSLVVPLLGIAVFIALWAALAPQVQTSLGTVPGPAQVAEQAGSLYADWERTQADKTAFYERQDARNQQMIEAGYADRVKVRDYTGAPTYPEQILTSLQTVFLGFLLATVIAVPVGIACGLSSTINGALNPLIQIFKPVSPLAWLPIVTMIVSALYVNASDAIPKSMVVSAITVTLCSLWPTLINTSLGVASIDKDLVNVGKVLQLSTAKTITKLVLPSAMPLIFTGLRLSLGVGWMVLIAAEMLAQNPGLGKFVWDEFQNGSSNSLARIIVAVITIGIVGFILDRIMAALQAAFTFSGTR
ncbi:ABC transporter permease [Fulvimarina sp. 2208YS6-2-32]|uniref:ABC transporter permease n=1 Tax=Fulvimarina uroteuthidis TaxID=3098149 RepID=A0ABU5I096_9HYPH|nr:ABC transporter permease [Fulvimarina sp. 2208YS6-2-32]MDY8108811.1 ABC transporter permease [Fulvimarina sp. 2208YS6-2-32]